MRDTRVLIAIPALDVMPVQTTYSLLSLKRDCPSKYSFIVRASCHDARNMLTQEAIETNTDRVLWIDSDMVFGPDLMERLNEDIDAGWDMVCGIFFKREFPLTPVIYKGIDADSGKANVYSDYPQDTLFPVAGCGFGAVMTTTDLLRRVVDNYGKPFMPYPRLSEDLSFSYRAQKLGARMACDSRIKVGHVGQITFEEKMYKE